MARPVLAWSPNTQILSRPRREDITHMGLFRHPGCRAHRAARPSLGCPSKGVPERDNRCRDTPTVHEPGRVCLGYPYGVMADHRGWVSLKAASGLVWRDGGRAMVHVVKPATTWRT